MTKKKKDENINKKKLFIIIAAAAAIIVAIIVLYFLFIKSETRINRPEDKVNDKFAWLLDHESTELENFNMYDAQNSFYEATLKMYKEYKPDLKGALIITNPFVISPQSALILFKTDEKEKVTITIKGKHDDDITRTFEASKDHIIPIYGLYEDYKNEVEVKTESGDSTTITIELEKYVGNVAVNAKVEKNELGNTNGKFFFGTSSLGAPTVAYDNYGEVRWYLIMGYSKGMTMLQNGHLLLSNDSEGPDITSTSGVVEVDMMGYVHHEYRMEGGYHHDGYELENGNLLMLTSDTTDGTFADYIVELDRKTGKVIKEWGLTKIVKEIDPSITEFYPTWGWINSISYDKKTDSLILSVRNQNSVISVNYSTGKLNWILGKSEYWSSAFDKYLIKGVGADFIYPAGQHSVYLLEDGRLSIFNNGYNAHNEEEQSCASLRNNASYAMIYSIDTDTMTATVDWKYGGQEYFSYALSSYNYTSDNHSVFNSGWHFSDLIDYSDPECTQFNNEYYDATIIELDENRNEIFKMVSPQSLFEVIKADIYNLAESSIKPTKKKVIENYKAKKAKVTSSETSTYTKLSESEALNYKYADVSLTAISAISGRVKVNVVASLDKEVNIIFINLQGDAYKFNLKAVGEEDIKTANVYALPSGRYYIFVEEEGIVLNSGQHIIVN